MTKSQLHKISFLFSSTITIIVLFLVLQNIQAQKNISAQAQAIGNMQVITITAKNGYSPNIIEAEADVPTILRIKTEDTYDCSAVINIPKLNYSKFLPPDGDSDIQILPQQEGTTIAGSCSMGMYGFTINFV